MKNKSSFYKNTIAYVLFVVIIIWVNISCLIQSLKCPQMTQTQIFLNIPHSILCEWKCCVNY
jgi:hypothetical protein